MSKPLFIVTTDSETAKKFREAGFIQLQEHNGKQVFLNNDKLSFSGIDHTKFMKTNIVQI